MSAFRPLLIGSVCSSNMNRSMEAHDLLQNQGYHVHSYGTGTHVRLPGATQESPVVFDFGTPYEKIRSDLWQRNVNMYTQNGVLNMLERNHKIKKAPQSFQLQSQEYKYDLLYTFEEKVYNAVKQHLVSLRSGNNKQVYLINIPTQDDRESAVVGAWTCLKITQALEEQPLNRWEDTVNQLKKLHQLELGLTKLTY